ncbi:MAG: hypothetical protein ABR575_08065 [Actinomycetota bacterium]
MTSKRAGQVGVVLWVALVLGGCGEAPPPTKAAASPGPDQLYEGTGLVLDAPDREPEFCLGGYDESLPPQCEGIPLARWDWTEVDGEEAAAGTTWGTFHLVGNYDGAVFTVRDTGPPDYEQAAESDPVTTPCPEPAAGWTATDPARASHENVVDAQRLAGRQPDFAGLWIDYHNEPPGGPTEEDPGDIILNVAFTGDLERHERELGETWGGPLCLSEHQHTLQELEEIQDGFPADEFDLDLVSSSIDVVRGVVEISVLVVDPETSQRIDDRYGEGVVEVEARLKPVDQ